jgi:sulfur carrier protein ThiS adenylyltransferase
MDYLRQQDLVNQDAIERTSVTLIGCGALGSTSAMALAKMGVREFVLYDDDMVSEENLPNQMYGINDLGKPKVVALTEVISNYNDTSFISSNKMRFDEFHNPKTRTLIVTTDSMSSRRLAWNAFMRNNECSYLIEARMGAEEGQVYTIRKKNMIIEGKDITFYEERLYTDAEAVQAPCTGKAIIYNVFMIGALISRSFKAYTDNMAFPRCVVMSWKFMDKRSFMLVE